MYREFLRAVLLYCSDMVSAGVESMEAKISKAIETQAVLWEHQETIGSNQSTILAELHTLKQSLQRLTTAVQSSDGESLPGK